MVLETIRNRRSIRKFTDEPVTRDQLAAILEAGRWAPSGKNNQPCRFLAITPPDPRQETLAGCTSYGAIVRNARALIAVFLDRSCMYHPMKDHQSAGACIQNMLLAIHHLGLGAVWLGEIVNQEDQVMAGLGLSPDELSFMALLAIGHPAAKGASSRHPLSTFLLEEL